MIDQRILLKTQQVVDSIPTVDSQHNQPMGQPYLQAALVAPRYHKTSQDSGCPRFWFS